jgi:GRASP55/65 PDZ-like domain
LYVYNNEYDITREVTIHPSRDWGGEGALGCVLGFGALHRLPAPLSEPLAEPGETLFSTDHEVETARFSNEEFRPGSDIAMENFFIPAVAVAPGQEPASLLITPQMTGPPRHGSPSAKKDKRHGHGKALKSDRLMEDYFIEGEKKSREIDFAPSVKRTAPPPPKAGGLQKGAPTDLPEAEKTLADEDNQNAID